MSVQEEINQAIAAHREWKFKLKNAINTGECESTPDKVKMDNNCAFGKWLHERIEPSVRMTADYSEVVDLHAQFTRKLARSLNSL